MKLKLVLILILAQIACANSVPQAGPTVSPTVTISPLPAKTATPTATPSQSCYTVTAEEGLYVRSLPTVNSPTTAILKAGESVTATDKRKDIHGNLWRFIGAGWSRADWMIETECK